MGFDSRLARATNFLLKIYHYSLKHGKLIYFTLDKIPRAPYPSLIRETGLPKETARRFLKWACKRLIVFKEKGQGEWFSRYRINYEAVRFLRHLVWFCNLYSKMLKQRGSWLELKIVKGGDKE
ncbi:MAG TPA: hypothetical protein EYP46_03945 [Hadesarchaea archaeon]|nr:hypothetical protein [Hadesarchaea archaeon]